MDVKPITPISQSLDSFYPFPPSYQELAGFYQNHIRYIKSIENFTPIKQRRKGSCMDYQRDRTDCKAKEWNMPMTTNEWEAAVYDYWHPHSVADNKSGCYLKWSQKSDECLANGGSGGVCDQGPLEGNKVYYPCGFGSLVYSQGMDTFAVRGSEIRESAEEISFPIDYQGAYLNLDPEGR